MPFVLLMHVPANFQTDWKLPIKTNAHLTPLPQVYDSFFTNKMASRQIYTTLAGRSP